MIYTTTSKLTKENLKQLKDMYSTFYACGITQIILEDDTVVNVDYSTDSTASNLSPYKAR